jgi:hypothetical protein
MRLPERAIGEAACRRLSESGDRGRPATPEALMTKHCGADESVLREHPEREFDKTFVVRIQIERMTGKAHRALAGAGA